MLVDETTAHWVKEFESSPPWKLKCFTACGRMAAFLEVVTIARENSPTTRRNRIIPATVAGSHLLSGPKLVKDRKIIAFRGGSDSERRELRSTSIRGASASERRECEAVDAVFW